MTIYRKTLGKKGEELVINHLKEMGYIILEKNYINNRNLGEIDIIAKKDKNIFFIEVKSRKKDFLSPIELVPFSKRKKIIQTAELFIVEKKIDLDENIVSFDIAYVNSENSVFYYKNAFQKECNY